MVTVNGGTDGISHGTVVTWLQPIVAMCDFSPEFHYVPIFKKTWTSRFVYEFSQFLTYQKTIQILLKAYVEPNKTLLLNWPQYHYSS